MVCASQPGISLRELVSLLGLSADDYLAMLYRTYIDDSADEKQEIVMVAGALIGTQKQWNELSRKWNICLRHHGMSYFKSSEYNRLEEEFERFHDEDNYPKPTGRAAARAIRDELEAIIKRVPILGLACAVPLPMYRKLVEEYELSEKLNPDPFIAASQTVMRESALLARDKLPRGKKDRDNRIAFVCDDTDNARNYSDAYAGFKAKNVAIQDTLGGLSHQDDKHTPPLQMADMVASISKEMAFEYIKTGGRVELRRLQGVFHKLIVWDEPTMRELASLQ